MRIVKINSYTISSPRQLTNRAPNFINMPTTKVKIRTGKKLPLFGDLLLVTQAKALFAPSPNHLQMALFFILKILYI